MSVEAHGANQLLEALDLLHLLLRHLHVHHTKHW